MTTLFDLSGYTSSPVPVHDPYWDEIVLDVNPKPDASGQLTLFYDDSQEPPDPDDFPLLDDYRSAWDRWYKANPDSVSYLNRLNTKSVREQKNVPQFTTNKVAPEHSTKNVREQVTQWVEQYYVTRSRKKHYYYRYCYMDGRKINHKHIGSINSLRAITQKEAVEQAIAREEKPPQIIQLIKSMK